MAIVVDEYGGTAGLVTLEDLHRGARRRDRRRVRRRRAVTSSALPDGDAAGSTAGRPIDEVNELLGLELPDGDWDTVGGFVFSTLGHVPAQGEAVEIDGWRFTAEQVEGRRIRRVRVSLASPKSDSVEPTESEAHRTGS